MLERLPFEQLHNNERPAFLFANVVNGADVRMTEGGGGTGFALETLERLAILGKTFGQKLQGHAAAEPRVFRLVHHPHTAATELLDDPVMGDSIADHEL